MSPKLLRRFISGSLALAFVIHTCRARARLFPRRSPPRLLTAAARGGLRPPPARRPRRATRPTKARLLHLSYSTASSGLVFYIQPPSTFVFAPNRQSRDHRAVGSQVRLADRRISRALARTRVSGQPRRCRDRGACRVGGWGRPASTAETGAGVKGVVTSGAARRAQCHGSDSRVDRVAVTVGDHRAVCSPQPAAADRRPRIRGVAPPRRTNLAPPATPISLCCFSFGCGVAPDDDVRPREPSAEVCESYDPRVSTDAREVAAGGFLTDPGRGT